ncbi:ATP-binding protein [candidate division KSB1 bacterium]|nr:ATP-binding protein [candidate division KSB1 bacterium]
MSIEQALIARSRCYAIGVRARELLQREASKGGTPEICRRPVCLEAAFLPSTEWHKPDNCEHDIFVMVTPPRAADLRRVHCLISRQHEQQWLRAERFLKELNGASYRMGFEISGNRDGVDIGFLLHEKDLDLLQVAFDGEFPDCRIEPARSKPWQPNLFFYDFFPSAPYHHLQTQPEQLQISPYDPFIRAIARLPSSTQGFVQVLFEPARHNWHGNVELLTDIEFLGQAMADPYSAYRTLSLPSGELKGMAREVETKAHYDKPFYFVAIRTGVRTQHASFDAWPLTAFTGLLHRDGQPLQFVTEQDYLRRIEPKAVQAMLRQGLTYRPGFLLNSAELAALVHLPNIEAYVREYLPLVALETLTLPPSHRHLMSGIQIGFGWYQGQQKAVCINDAQRKTSLHIIGRPGTGKTTTIEHMVLQDIAKGRGVAYIDPHGDSVKRLLHFIPENRVDATIYLDFGDPEWVPLWNPLQRVPAQTLGRTADDLVAAIKSVVQKNAWSDRLEHNLRNGFYALLHLEDATFLDLLTLFQDSKDKNSAAKNRLRARILACVDNEVARMFWQRDYERYRREDFAPPLHKLSKLLTGDETVSLMLTQPENRLDMHRIMNSGKILLLDVSNLGADTRGILGCFLLTFLYNSALFRNRLHPDARKTFSIYCDEAHKFTTDSLADLIAEGRKFGVNLTLAHQFLDQFKAEQRGALTSTGSTIIFNVDMADARYLAKELQGKVEPKELAMLKTGEAIARIYTDILKIRTRPPEPLPEQHFRDEIIENSRQLYCRKATEVREYLRKKQNRATPGCDFSNPIGTGEMNTDEQKEALRYEEFE